MIQQIIVYIIIATVLIYTVYKLVRSVTTKPVSGCGGCTGCGIKEEITKRGKTTTQNCSCDTVKKD